jgi:uncharacterized ferritin-like protein (DUF455 family)
MEQYAVVVAMAKVTIRLVAQIAKSDMSARKKKTLIVGTLRNMKKQSAAERPVLVVIVKKKGTPSEPVSILKLIKRKRWLSTKSGEQMLLHT